MVVTAEGKPLRLSEDGIALLETWSEDASQADRNAVYTTLFRVADGSVGDTHIVMADGDARVVLVRRGIFVKIRYVGEHEFAVLHIGIRGELDDQEMRAA